MSHQSEVLNNFYVKLVAVLPMQDAKFKAELVCRNLLPGNLKALVESKETVSDKAMYFLDHKIKPDVSIGDFTSFDKLLDAMKNWESDTLNKLANEIKINLDLEKAKLSLNLGTVSSSVIPEGRKRLERPNWKDLNLYVSAQYASQWQTLGATLGLEVYYIQNISKNHPNDVVQACGQMLLKWLQLGSEPTWGKLDDAIKMVKRIYKENGDHEGKKPSDEWLKTHPAKFAVYPQHEVVPSQSITCHEMTQKLKDYHLSNRFRPEKNAWPPGPPTEYTPLALIHHKTQLNKDQIYALQKAKGDGNVDSILAATGKQAGVIESDGNDLAACLPESTSTREISDILAPLDDASNALSRTVLIEGAPGLGKTVLLKQIAFKWAQGYLLGQSDFVFLLTLRDPDVQQLKSLGDLMHYFSVRCFSTEDTQKLKDYADIILKTHGKSTTFLLDGYDELPLYARQKSFIAMIVDHEILRLSAVVISSRPHASANLRSNAACYVDILGFTETDQKSFFDNSLKEEKSKKLTAYLECHPAINNLCFTPFHATILVWFCKNDIPLPESSTFLYGDFVMHTILHHLAREKGQNAIPSDIGGLDKLPEPYSSVIISLSKLCRKALKKNELVFTNDLVTKAIKDDPSELNAYGLLQAVEHYSHDEKFRGKPTKTFNFIHFSVQEFLAAYHFTCLKENKELKCLNKYFFHQYFGNTALMYVGMTGGKRPAFKTFLASYGKGMFARIKRNLLFEAKKNLIASKFFEDDRKCLKLFQCFYEANEERSWRNITKQLLSSKTIDLQKGRASTEPLLISELQCLAFFLSKSPEKAWSLLNLSACHIGNTGLRMLHQCLCVTTNTITVYCLDLQSNSLTSQITFEIAGIVIYSKTKRLILAKNQLEGVLDLSKCSTLLELDISHNKFSSKDAGKLFNTLSSKLRMLRIDHNPLREEAIDALANYLQRSTTLEELYAKKSNLSSDNAIKIFSKLRDAKNIALKILDLSENFISDEAVHEIILGLQKDFLKTLYLQGNNITTPSIEKIVDSLADNQNLATLAVPDNISDLTQIYTKQQEINKKRKNPPKLRIRII